jgi:hypothetical protein
VSRELLNVAEAQRAALRGGTLLGVPVYAGGDDLLAFVPGPGWRVRKAAAGVGVFLGARQELSKMMH